MLTTSDQLTQTALAYAAEERRATGRFQPGQGGGPGTDAPSTGPAPAPGFTDGADVAPKPPEDECLTAWAEDKLADLLGEVTAVVRFFTGYDVTDEWAPVVLGDWGALYRLAEAYGEVSHSVRAIHDDVAAGRDAGAPHWHGDAAAAFDRHMRNRADREGGQGPVARHRHLGEPR